MPLSKKRRERLWTGYVIGMVVVYELPMLVLGVGVLAFLIAFGGIGVLTITFVIVMRRLTAVPGPPGAGPASEAGEPLDDQAQRADHQERDHKRDEKALTGEV